MSSIILIILSLMLILLQLYYANTFLQIICMIFNAVNINMFNKLLFIF